MELDDINQGENAELKREIQIQTNIKWDLVLGNHI